ncbi:DUF5819 family protein [Streptomyces purpurogeneiscleroticus]|uniref:DUF5819 family protein n=1 Tax=Streptomyces purpurogeneiscleroticus TaxID=68259 RepID=UPI001CBD1113|nr:DUF5819 family protein [Streptomyces purpurogeneiscleroticus]MBZ4020735.1 hypothetical protein [Streptomyces purpurogeneiscleroticus]
MQSYADETRPPQVSPVTALSLPSRIVVATAAGGIAIAALVHIAMMFLHVAPSNTVTKAHGAAVSDYVYPEYEQNWKLFAPNPLQQNISVHVRAEIRPGDGGSARRTGWTDLTAIDGRAIHHNLLPSHTQQNELRRAWESFVGSHDAQNRSNGVRGELTERYLRRIAMGRLGAEWTAQGGTVARIEFRSVTTPVGPPPWSSEKISNKPVYRVLPWWPVTVDDVPEGASNQ